MTGTILFHESKTLHGELQFLGKNRKEEANGTRRLIARKENTPIYYESMDATGCSRND